MGKNFTVILAILFMLFTASYSQILDGHNSHSKTAKEDPSSESVSGVNG
jgi:hypothetical protein